VKDSLKSLCWSDKRCMTKVDIYSLLPEVLPQYNSDLQCLGLMLPSLSR
jgi:hypothetical protein